MSQDDLSPKKLLVQRYRLKEVIGVGGMGTVYRAEDTASKNKNVAVKILSRALDDMKMIQQFQTEATLSALLSERSQNIVKVSDYGVNQQQAPFYVMEYLDGESLSQMIDTYDLTIATFLDFTIQICRAMQIAHNGIFFSGQICPVIHRDLKPSNILVIEEETGKQIIKVLDFGIAQIIKDDNGKVEKFMGTPKYCSPEQLKGGNLDNRSDIYSLGMIMYQMLSKKYPWNLEVDSVGSWYKAHTQIPPSPFSPELNIPPAIEQLVLRCLAKSTNNRPQSIGEILQQLENFGRTLVNRKTFPNLQNINQSTSSVPKKDKLKDFLIKSTWPSNKPQQKIVFPRVIYHQNKLVANIFTMLEEEDIVKRKNNIRYNKFVFQSFPHPMVLWITALYSVEDGARWLPCYLDLKSKIGIQLINALSESNEYFLLFFSLQNPHLCQDLLSFRIGLKQRTSLKQWASVSKMLNVKHNEEAIVSRRKLKEDLAELKPQILLELAKTNTEEIHD